MEKWHAKQKFKLHINQSTYIINHIDKIKLNNIDKFQYNKKIQIEM